MPNHFDFSRARSDELHALVADIEHARFRDADLVVRVHDGALTAHRPIGRTRPKPLDERKKPKKEGT